MVGGSVQWSANQNPAAAITWEEQCRFLVVDPKEDVNLWTWN